MAGYLGTKAVLLSTTAASVGGDAEIGGDLTVGGTVTADGLTVDENNNIQINRDGVSSAKVFWNRGSTQDAAIELNASEDLNISVDDAALGGKHLNLLNNNKLGFRLSDGGDISFYEDTGTTAKFFWDASAESLGIGTSSPTGLLTLDGGGDTYIALTHSTAMAAGLAVQNRSNGQEGVIAYNSSPSNERWEFFVNSTERMRIDASGRVTMPYQPAFKAGMNASTFDTGASSTQIIYDFTHFDRGGHYNTSTGRYTVPVTGLYEFTHNVSARNNHTGVFEIKLFQNGVEKHRQFTFGNGGSHGASATAILACSQGDYIDTRGYWATGVTLSGDLDVGVAGVTTLSYFSGYLIG